MGIHGGLVPESLKAGSSSGSVLLGDGELPGGEATRFSFFPSAPAQPLLLRFGEAD